MSTAETKTVLVRISGRVQGVWFRDWTHRTAVSLGLEGWVRNRHDGSVEALFSGAAGAVDDMVRRCASGSPSSRVDNVEAQPAPRPDALSGFDIRMTK